MRGKSADPGRSVKAIKRDKQRHYAGLEYYGKTADMSWFREYIDEEKWKAEYSHSRVLIKSKTDSKELLITGRCIDPNKVKGLNPDYFYIISSSPEVEEYLESRGATPLYRIAYVKAVALNFMREE